MRPKICVELTFTVRCVATHRLHQIPALEVVHCHAPYIGYIGSVPIPGSGILSRTLHWRKIVVVLDEL